MKRKTTLEIIIYPDEYRVVYDNNAEARVVRTFSKDFSGRLDLLCFLMGFLGLHLKIGRRFRELFKEGGRGET